MFFNSISSYLHQYSKIRGRTKKVVTLIEPSLIDFSLSKNQFSLGDLARHIPLLELHFYIPIIKGQPTSYSGCSASFAANTIEILNLLDQTEQQLAEVLTAFDDEQLSAKIKIPSGEISLQKWLQLILEHEIHHRGQIYQLLSFKGVKVPNIFGLSSEDLIGLSKNN